MVLDYQFSPIFGQQINAKTFIGSRGNPYKNLGNSILGSQVGMGKFFVINRNELLKRGLKIRRFLSPS
jgi:hypothetical protein